jgi:endonuclease/exonuclease/phosphatase family metal-dependent hydrolase
MKYFIFLLLLLVSTLKVGAQSKVKVIAVGFYNCENFFYPEHDSNKKDEDFTPTGDYHYTFDIYKQKLHNIATVMSKMATDVTPDGPAVIGMAEVESDKVLSDLIRQPELKDRHYQYAWFYTSDERGISTAMLYNPKYLQVIASEPIKVDLSHVGTGRPTRDILHVYGILAGDTVHIFVNHWPSKAGPEEIRKIAARTLMTRVDSLLKMNNETKILILGDFNDNPTEPAIAKELHPKAERQETGLTDLFNPWIDMYNKGMGSEQYRGEWNLIDQIMVSGAFIKNDNHKWQLYRQEIFNRPFLNNQFGRDKGLPHRSFTINNVWDDGYSDHYPVIMYFIERTK